MPYKRKCGCVVTTSSDAIVRKGIELSGGLIKRCEKHDPTRRNGYVPKAYTFPYIKPSE